MLEKINLSTFCVFSSAVFALIAAIKVIDNQDILSLVSVALSLLLICTAIVTKSIELNTQTLKEASNDKIRVADFDRLLAASEVEIVNRVREANNKEMMR